MPRIIHSVPVIFALLSGCDQVADSTNPDAPDLSEYALQADLEAALEEIDELRAEIGELPGRIQTITVDCAAYGTTADVNLESSDTAILSVQTCYDYTTDELAATCANGGYALWVSADGTASVSVGSCRVDDEAYVDGEFQAWAIVQVLVR